MVEREQGRLRFTDWDFDEIRFLKAMGYSSYGIAAIISKSPDHVRKLIRVHGLDTPLSKSETTYLAVWHYVRDLTRRKLKPDTTNIAAAYMASKMVVLSAELRRLERHMETAAARRWRPSRRALDGSCWHSGRRSFCRMERTGCQACCAVCRGAKSRLLPVLRQVPSSYR